MTAQVERMLPLYEGKMIHHYDHRWATYDGLVSRDATPQEKSDASFTSQPRYWVREELVWDRLGAGEPEQLLGWRDICRSTDERTMIASSLPMSAVGHTLPLVFSREDTAILQAVWSSFAFDYVARQMVGGTHMTYSYLKQLATPPPNLRLFWAADAAAWFHERVSLLQSPSSWGSVDRLEVRCELDAAVFHILGVARDDIDYILDSFEIVRRKDELAHGEYRTKRLVLEAYDQLALFGPAS